MASQTVIAHDSSTELNSTFDVAVAVGIARSISGGASAAQQERFDLATLIESLARVKDSVSAALAVRNEALGFGVSVWILRRAMEALAGDIDASMKNAATATASMSTLARLAAEHTEAANRAALALQAPLSATDAAQLLESPSSTAHVIASLLRADLALRMTILEAREGIATAVGRGSSDRESDSPVDATAATQLEAAEAASLAGHPAAIQALHNIVELDTQTVSGAAAHKETTASAPSASIATAVAALRICCVTLTRLLQSTQSMLHTGRAVHLTDIDATGGVTFGSSIAMMWQPARTQTRVAYGDASISATPTATTTTSRSQPDAFACRTPRTAIGSDCDDGGGGVARALTLHGRALKDVLGTTRLVLSLLQAACGAHSPRCEQQLGRSESTSHETVLQLLTIPAVGAPPYVSALASALAHRATGSPAFRVSQRLARPLSAVDRACVVAILCDGDDGMAAAVRAVTRMPSAAPPFWYDLLQEFEELRGIAIDVASSICSVEPAV